MNSTRCHPTCFMVDFESLYGPKDNLMGYVKREPNYDITFCRAFKAVMDARDTKFTSSKELLTFLDKIQRLSLSHFPEIKLVGKNAFQPIHGRAYSLNFYGISSQTPNSDEEGVKEIIRKIWIDKESFKLKTNSDSPNIKYLLTNESFNIVLKDKGQEGILFENGSSNTDTIQKIFDTLIPLYRAVKGPNEPDCMMLIHHTMSDFREKKVIQILDNYLAEIQTKDSEIEKIRTIAVTIQGMMQQHLYFDGNGRSLYLLANLLMYQNGLKLFYPRNMCMFDANACDTMVKEIISGQERFALKFGDASEFSEGLMAYGTALTELSALLQKEYSDYSKLIELTNARDFNLLLRQVCAQSECVPLLEFLLKNKSALGIDIFSKGEKSGNALDIANKYNNEDAAKLLIEHGLSKTCTNV